MYHFITNPTSSGGRGIDHWHEIEEYLKQNNIEYQLHTTEYDRRAREIAADLTAASEMVDIIVLGGDGSVNETVNGIRDLTKVRLGYIPTGSGNDLARSLRLPKDRIKCLQMILEGDNYRPIDVGFTQSEGLRRRFLISSGIGFDAAVCQGVEVSVLKKILGRIGLGRLVYLGIALKQICQLDGSSVTLQVDEGEEETFSGMVFAAAMNHPYEGGGFLFCPKARDDDGKLDMCLVSDIGKLKVLMLLPTAFFGKHVLFKKYVHIYSGSSYRIKASKRLNIHTDGEPVAVRSEFFASQEQEKLLFAAKYSV